MGYILVDFVLKLIGWEFYISARGNNYLKLPDVVILGLSRW